MSREALSNAMLFAESEVENRSSAGAMETDYVNEAQAIVDECAAALTALNRVWQPIGTAPKDGKEILISSVGFGMLVRIAFWDEARGGMWSIWPGREPAGPSFTHWRPLPEPPRFLSEVQQP